MVRQRQVLAGALVLSVLVHVALVLGVGRAFDWQLDAAHTPPLDGDSWVGDTFDLASLLPASPELMGSPDEQRATPTEAPASPPVPPEPPDPVADDEGIDQGPVDGGVELPSAPKVSASRSASRPSASSLASHSPATASSSATSSTPPAGPVSTGPGSAGSGHVYGAAGTTHRVRNLPRAFARAIPPANAGVPIWEKLPLGPAGSCQAIISVDGQGKITQVEVEPKDAPTFLRRVVDRTLILLRAGRFALSHAERGGSERLQLSVTLSQREGAEDEQSAGPYGLGYDAPTKSRPGRAYFTLRSGRHVELTITILPP